MKHLVLLSAVMFSTSVLAKNIFWCDPSVHLKKLEAVIVREEASGQVMAVYTESRRWGTVDEKIKPILKKTIAGNSTELISSTASLVFDVNIDKLKPGSIVIADFQDSEFNIKLKVSCEYMPY